MRRRLRRRPAPRKALTPKSTIWKAPGSDDSGALRLALFSALKAVIVLVPTGAGWDAIPFLRSCRGTRRTRTLRFSLLRGGERPGRHPDVASGGYSYPSCPRYATWCERRGGVVRSDIRVPEAKRGRVPCRNEGEHRPSHVALTKQREASPRAQPSRSRC